MIGAEFTGVLHAAQQGRAAAFSRLWADANPSLTRYLRVVSVADADDVACESWVTVVRRLPGFEGDETAWRALVFSAARMHAEDGNQRRVWDALVEPDDLTALVTSPLPAGEEPFEDDEVEGGPAHGLRMTIGAIRDLPPEQGEVLMLRLVGELPEASVAELVGADTATVHGLEQQALDRLGADAELVSWALSADPRPVELADEDVVLAVFRAMVPERAQVTRSGAAREVSPTGAKVITLPRPTWRTRAGVAAGTSLALVGLGALSAAAYQGVLPDSVQVVLHKVIGAPPPATTSDSEAEPAVSSGPHVAGAATSALRREGSGPAVRARVAAVGLCTAWAVDRGQNVAKDRSTAFRRLVVAAGGEDHVAAYCAAAGRPGYKPTNPPTSVPPTTAEPTATGKPTKGAPTKTPTVDPEPVKTKPVKTKPAKQPSPTTVTPAPTESPSTTEPAPETTSGTGTETGGAQQGRGGRSTSAPGAGTAPDRR